jgi:hypothetical protein
MQAEIFTNVLLSYQRLLSKFGSFAPGLRDYCRSQHVVYRTFIRWACTQSIASGILEVDSIRERVTGKGFGGRAKKTVSNPTLATEHTGTPLLHPLHIITEADHGHRMEPATLPPARSPSSSLRREVVPSPLRGIRITLPNGTKLSIREADSSGVYALVHGITL